MNLENTWHKDQRYEAGRKMGTVWNTYRKQGRTSIFTGLILPSHKSLFVVYPDKSALVLWRSGRKFKKKSWDASVGICIPK